MGDNEVAMTMKKGNPENLSPIRSTEEARARGHNGGIKSGESRRIKKTMKTAAKMLLDMPANGPNLQRALQSMGLNDDDMTMQMAILVSMLKESLKGNVRAAEFLRDTAGENIDKNRQYELNKRAAARADEEFEFKKKKEAGLAFELEDMSDVEDSVYSESGRRDNADA